MKVIKEGDMRKVAGRRHYRGECSRCGCVFEFEDRELIKSDWQDMSSRFIRCPTCDNVIYSMSKYIQQI